jgi:hypothetical protein
MSENILPEYDKSTWSKGEWNNEPDRVDFLHAGFSCFILRNRSGNWCGYVGVPSTHPSYGKDYNDVDVDVHGGLTYADSCNGHICHIPEPGMPDNVWWLGFDTGHYMDASPCQLFAFRNDDGVYRNVEYVTNEVKHLADQLKAME